MMRGAHQTAADTPYPRQKEFNNGTEIFAAECIRSVSGANETGVRRIRQYLCFVFRRSCQRLDDISGDGLQENLFSAKKDRSMSTGY